MKLIDKEFKMNIIKIKYFASLILVVMLILCSFSYALNTVDTGFRLEAGNSVEIDAHNNCRNVINTGLYNIFIPTRTLSEWQSFINAVQQISYININDCAPSGEWVQIFNNSYWTCCTGCGEPFTCSWTGSEWSLANGDGGEGYIIVKGSWADGYRPTKIRVTYTYFVWASGDDDIYVRNSSSFWGTIGSDSSYSSMKELELSNTSGDIYTLRFGYPSDVDITNIEFFQP